MQFRKLAAIAGAGLMTAVSMAAPVLAATTVGDVVGLGAPADSTLDFPVFVLGTGGTGAGIASDVSGAINVAVRMAAESKTKTVSTTTLSTETSVGGAKIETPGNALEPWESTQSVKSVFTKTDLADMLGDGSFQTATGGTYTYKQYLYPGTTSALAAATTPLQMKYERASTGSQTTSPDLWLKSTGSNALYTYKLSFSTAVPLTSVTTTALLQAVLQGQTLKILNKDYVISDCTHEATNIISDFTLLGGDNVVLVNHIAGDKEATEKTVTIGGKDYKVTFKGVTTSSSVNYASFALEESGTKTDFSIQQGGTGTFKGMTIGVIRVGSTAVAGGTEEMKLVLGADKIKIYNSGTVVKGTTTIADLTADITASSSGWSTFTLTYTPSSDKWLAKGESIDDPFISAFKIKYSGATPDFTDKDSRQTITLARSGDNMYLTYKNAGGAEKQMYSVLYDTACTPVSNKAGYCFAAVASGSPTNFDNNYRDVVFDESKNISAIEQDYFVIQKGGFSHTMQFTTFSPATSELTFSDESGNSITATNTTTADLIVDGNTYKVTIIDETKKIVAIDLNGDGYQGIGTNLGTTAYTNALAQLGAQYSFLVPEKITTGNGGLYFYRGNTSVTIPTASYGYPALGFAGIRLSNASTTVSVGAYGFSDAAWSTAAAGTWTNSATTLTVPTSGYSAWTNYTVNYIDFGIRCQNTTASGTYSCEAALGGTTGAQTDSVGYILVQEALQGTTTHNWIYMPLTYDSTYKVSVSTPVSDDSNYVHTAVQGTSTEYKGMTKYGTLVEDKSAQLGGGATFNYPDLYMYGNVWFLKPEGTVTSTAAGEGYDVIEVTTDVVKLDTEVDTATVTTDLVVVGGPCVNKIAADLLGKTYPACGADSGIPENAAIVKVFADKYKAGKAAILVAGWEATDTDLATRAIQTGKLAENTKTAVKISGTDVATATIEEWTEVAPVAPVV